MLALVAAPGVARAQPCIASSGTTVAEWCYRRGDPFARLAISRDDGVTWEQTGVEVDDATVHDEATVVGLVDTPSPHLVIFEASGPRAIPLPVEHGLAVRSAGGRLFVLAERPGDDAWGLRVEILVSDDLGAHLREAGTLAGFASLAGAVADARGPSLEVWSSEGLSCFGTVIERRYRLESDVLTASLVRDDMACAYTGARCSGFEVVGLGAHGAMYGLRIRGERWALVHVGASRRLARTSLETSGGATLVGTNGRITLAIVDHRLARLEGARVIPLSSRVPEGAEALHVDARGRAWVLAEGGIHRFTRAGGFVLLRPIP